VLEWAILIVVFDGFQTFHNPQRATDEEAAVSGAGPEICTVGKNLRDCFATVKSTHNTEDIGDRLPHVLRNSKPEII